MALPALLFVSFALLAAAGAYWIVTATLAGPRRRRAALGAALAVLVAFAALGAGLTWLIREGTEPARPRPRRPSRPNVVVVLVDTLRADHTSLEGYRRDTTPELARIAAGGLTLRRHFVNAPWTKPSVASILTGLPPSAHGARTGQFRDRGKGQTVEVLSPELTTLAEVFAADGYRTHAWISNYQLTPKWGFAQGYDDYDFERGRGRGPGGMPAVDEAGVDYALDALAAGREPAFVWLHWMSVHHYQVPEGFAGYEPEGATPLDLAAPQVWRARPFATLEATVAAYDSAVSYLDRELGRLADRIAAEHPDTILVVTSDHGEELYDHGGFEHGHTLYNELLWVPCVLTGPGVPRGEVTGITDGLDLFPTLTALAGIGTGQLPLAGRALVAAGTATSGKAATLAEQHHRGPWRRFSLLAADGHKLIVSEAKLGGGERLELYPGAFGIEGEPLAPGAMPHQVLTALRAEIETYRERTAAVHQRLVGATPTEELDPEDIEALRALGYLR